MKEALVYLAIAVSCFAQSGANLIDAPRIWNDRDLSDWATPVAGLNVRPGHYSEKEYYSAPVGEFVRTYPVYFPGREPAGYWDMLRNAKPEPLIKPGARTMADWIEEGKRVFHELDIPSGRIYDPNLTETLRSADEVKRLGGQPRKDGTLFTLRWVPTSRGLALSLVDCSGCHSTQMPDGGVLDGAPRNEPGNAGVLRGFSRDTSVEFPDDTPGMIRWRASAVPWVPNDLNDRLKTMDPAERQAFGLTVATPLRNNTGPFYPAAVPDLIGVKDRKYIDRTASHLLRGPEDLMRYAALISCCDIFDFGPYRMRSDKGRRIIYRFPDELLFALAQYIYSLEPPENPKPGDRSVAAGKKVFDREGCAGCHTPPLYTNNKLTLAAGFTLPKDHPLRGDVLPVSVGTEPNLALKTRVGTGFYKIPSLRGVWYRSALSHDGSVTTLEQWFDPARLRDDYVPSGFKGYKVTHRAVPGHEFGLKLNVEDKAALIAFLKTL